MLSAGLHRQSSSKNWQLGFLCLPTSGVMSKKDNILIRGKMLGWPRDKVAQDLGLYFLEPGGL